MKVFAGLTLLLASSAAALSLDGDFELNQGLNASIFHHQGQYSPRYLVTGGREPSNAPPLGCEVVQVNSIERHGARHFTSGAYKKTLATLQKVQAALKNVTDDQLSDKSLSFLRTYSIDNDTNSLVPYGALQAYYSGLSTRQYYKGLGSKPAFVRSTGDEADLDDRVIVTAKYWKLGQSGAPFPKGVYKTSQDVRQAPGLQEPDVVFSEKTGSNNTLNVDTCTALDNQTPDPESTAQQAYGATTISPVIGKRLLARLQPAVVNLTSTDILNLMYLCPFQTLSRAVVSDGKLSLTEDPVCKAFTADEWKIFGYAMNVGKYARAGYGNQYSRAVGQGYLRELYARLNGTAPPLDQPTSINATIDSNPKLFPIPVAGEKIIFFDGSHDNNIGPIATAFGLFNGPALTTEAHAENNQYRWDFSKIAPFQGKIVFEKLSCRTFATSSQSQRVIGGKKDFLRVRANGAVQDPHGAEWCPAASGSVATDPYVAQGLCPLDSALQRLSWVNQATEWNKCFA